jgi:hypothetical protein
MSGTTPSQPPRDPFAPPDGDLMFPAATDGTWQQGPAAGSRRRWVVVIAAVAVVVVVAGAVALGLRVLSNATSSPTDVAATGTPASIDTLAIGACYRLASEDRTADSIGDVDVVDCTSPHDGQVYAKIALTFADYPGDTAVSTAVDTGCGAQDTMALDPAVRAVESISPTWYGPLEADWADTPHVAACVIESDDLNGLTRSWTAGSKA